MLRVRTDAVGQYLLTGLPAGTHDLEVRQFGYRIERNTVELRSARTTTNDVVLERIAVARFGCGDREPELRYPEFDSHRRNSLEGHFLTKTRSKGAMSQVSDIVATMPGVLVRNQGSGATISRTRGGAFRGCPRARGGNVRPTRASNHLAFDRRRDGVLSARISAPMQYRSMCGTIMIWTKR